MTRYGKRSGPLGGHEAAEAPEDLQGAVAPAGGDSLSRPPRTPAAALIDAAAVAAMLALSLRHVRRMDTAGDLPRPVRLGRAVRWRVDELRAWIEAGCPDRGTWERGRRG